jgi:O-antigen/teichoic acid export membrane protein
MRQSHRLIYNALVGWASHVVEVAIGFLLLPFLVHRLGTACYGIFGLAFSVSAGLDFVRVGLAAALTKFVAGYAAQDRREEINRVLGTTCAFGTAFGLLSGGAVIALQGVLAEAMNIAPADRPTFQASVVLMGLLIAVTFGMMPYLGILLGYQRHDLMRMSQVGVRVLQALLMVGWFLMVGPSVTALAAITLICGGLLHLAWTLAAYRQWPWLRGSPRQFRWDALKMVVGFATMMILIGLSQMLLQQGSRWIVGRMLSVDFVTYLTVMITPAGFIYTAVQDLTLTIMPAASKLQATDDRSTLTDLFIRGTRYSFLIAGLCVAMSVPVLRSLLNIWMGPDFERLAWPMVVLIAGAGLGASGSCAHNLLKGLGKVGPVLVSGLVAAFASLAVMVAAIKWLNANDWAVTAGATTFYLLMLILQNWLCLAATRTSVRAFLWRSYIQPMMVLVPVVIVSHLVAERMGVHGIIATATTAVCTALVFALGFAVLFFSAEEWRLTREIWQAAARRLYPRR